MTRSPLEELVELCDDVEVDMVVVVVVDIVVVCVEVCDLDSDVGVECEVDVEVVEVDVGACAEVELELVNVMVTVVTISVFWDVVCDDVSDGAWDAVVEPLSELVVMGTVGGKRTWPPGTCPAPLPFPPSALVATTRVPAAASTTRVNTDTTDSF